MSKSSLQRHRTAGRFGLFLLGAVFFTDSVIALFNRTQFYRTYWHGLGFHPIQLTVSGVFIYLSTFGWETWETHNRNRWKRIRHSRHFPHSYSLPHAEHTGRLAMFEAKLSSAVVAHVVRRYIRRLPAHATTFTSAGRCGRCGRALTSIGSEEQGDWRGIVCPKCMHQIMAGFELAVFFFLAFVIAMLLACLGA